jgi:hypothetical protein
MEADIVAYGTFTTLETAIIGGWFVIIGYFFILFIYFLAFRFRASKNKFHLGFGLFFLLLGVGRAFFLIYDFYVPFVIWWSLATMVSWLAIFVVFFALTYQILERPIWQVFLISAPPLIISILVAALPFSFWPGFPDWIGYPTPLGYMIANYAFLPIYVIVLPLLFFYIGIQLVGQLRLSNFLIGSGLLVYYLGRVFQSTTIVNIINTMLPALGTVLAPILVFFSLVFIAVGVLYEEHE